MAHRHEIPTHLDVADRAFYGLTIRQVMYLTIGLSSGYSLWNQWPALPLLVRGVLAAVCVVLALILALVRPQGRSLDDWLFVALHHAAIPRVSLWQPMDPSLRGPAPSRSSWEELMPQLTWEEHDR